MEVQQINLGLVTPSPMNPRKTFDQEAIDELAASIGQQGLLQPITVRPITEGNALYKPEYFEQGYEIVCGERRWRAVGKLCVSDDDIKTIPAIVRDMTDEEAFDAMITENLQRKDVDPIEEAFSFGKLAELGKTAEEIAARFGKSIRFVQDRIKLNRLIPELMKEVRDGRCAITAAMLISKLDSDSQRQYWSQYQHNSQGYSKASAEAFVDHLFMTLDKALWADNPDFDGGCGCKCGECEFNTANHGCLFYEMKPDGIGRCTNRGKFFAKTESVILGRIESEKDSFVRKGEPLAFGKTVIGLVEPSYCGEAEKDLYSRLKTALGEYELVDPQRVFRSKCYYANDDERVLEKRQSGELYRVISLFFYNAPSFREEFWYVSGDQAERKAGLPVEAAGLIDKLKMLESSRNSSETFELVRAMSKYTSQHQVSNEPLTDAEIRLLCMLIIRDNYQLRKQLGLGQVGPREADEKAVDDNIGTPDMFLRAWLQSSLHVGDNPAMRQAEPLLDAVGALWCGDKYSLAKGEIKAKYEKSRDKILSRLAALGYGRDGEKLDVGNMPVLSQWREMKKKHPDAVLLFRRGDLYEIYGSDAKDASEILSLACERNAICGEDIEVVAFPYQAIDNYLPKLVNRGKRVAICEHLNDPKATI